MRAARDPHALASWHEQLRCEIGAIYDELTDGLASQLRVAELVYAAAERFPEQLPTRDAIAAERELPLKDKLGLEINQGTFVAHVLANRRAGTHLIHSMSQPRTEALALLDEFAREGAVNLGPVRVDREDDIGHVTTQNHAFLNSEDDRTVAALELAVNLVLLDDTIQICVLRGAPAVHPKYAGRRIFGSGMNLTHLYHGKVSLVEFLLERDLGLVSKIYRGHDLGAHDVELEQRREKPWIAAVDSFAIGGACQLLLVMDRVIAETGSYFNLPARKEGIIPGCANLRLPRFVGERIARQAIFFGRDFPADSPEGSMLADEVIPGDEIDDAVLAAATELKSAGMTSAIANRKALRVAQEPIEVFRHYMSNYAWEQSHCLYSKALIDNLEHHWDAKRRTL